MPFLPLWTPSEARPPIPRARGACRPAASPHPERSTQRLRQLTPAELACCSCPLLQRNPSQPECSIRCSSNLSGFLKSDCVRSNRTRCGPRGRIASRFAIGSSVELDQVLKDQLTPAISARLHKQSTFRKPAKFDRRETEIFRKRTNLRCGAVIVARQEHDSPATLYGRILVKDGSAQMVEAPNQSCTREGLRDDLRRRLTSQFLGGHAVGIGHIDDGLALPVRQRLRDIRVRLEADSQKDDVRLDRFRQFFGNDRGADRGRSGCKAFRVARGCNGYFDAVAGKRLGQGPANIAEADNCVAHMFSLGFPIPTGS